MKDHDYSDHRTRETTFKDRRIETIPYADNSPVACNIVTLIGVFFFFLGCMPFLLGFKMLLFIFIGVFGLAISLHKLVYKRTSWPAIIFTVAFIGAAAIISHQIKAEVPWTQGMKVWLYLIGIGLVLAISSMGLNALWTRRNWIYVNARCLDREMWQEWSHRSGNRGKTWCFQLLCEYELNGRTYKVTPSYWRTFAFKSSLTAFLDRKISISGDCRLHVNPDNPLEAEIGPNHRAGSVFFTPKRWLQILQVVVPAIIVGAGYHFYDLNDANRETIPNPVVALVAAGESEFEPAWRSGYPFKPYRSEVRDDGSILLLYRGEIKNNNLSLQRTNLDYDSCTVDGRYWLAEDKETHEPQKIMCPDAILVPVNLEQFEAAPGELYPSYAGRKNLQPDGRIYLSASVRLEQAQVGIILPAGYGTSIKRKAGQFSVKRPE